MDPVIFIQLAMPSIEPLPGFENHTRLLCSAHRFTTHTVLGFCDPAMTKCRGVGGIFNSVRPLHGEWTLEVALELPDLLPSLDGKSEAVVATKDAQGVTRPLCLSNRMSRFHFKDGSESRHVLMPRTEPWHGAAQVNGADGKTLLSAAEEQLRTVVSMRFQVKGDTAEHAFEASVKKCVNELFDCVNAVLCATRECQLVHTPITRSVRWDGVPAVYVLMNGDGAPHGALLALNGARVALISGNVEGDHATRFRAIANGSTPLSDVDQLIGEARSSWGDGEYEFAFLQTVIAAEIATTRAVTAECLRRGVSKSRLDDNRKEMTYSWALNIGLSLCFSAAVRPNEALISAMNAARSKRNDLMHEASFEMSREQLRQLLIDTQGYVRALAAATVSHGT